MPGAWIIRASDSGMQEQVMTTGGAAISWSMLRDVSGIRSLEEMRDLFHSDLSRSDSFGSQSMKAGQLFDFLHNVNEQDFVLTPIKETKTVRIGKIDGPYRYDETMFGFDHPHTRRVVWLRDR